MMDFMFQDQINRGYQAHSEEEIQVMLAKYDEVKTWGAIKDPFWR